MRQSLWPELTTLQHKTAMQAYLASIDRASVFVAVQPENTLVGFVEVSLHPHAGSLTSNLMGLIEEIISKP
ncbi:MAG: hypothetical protein WA110_06975 [Anaerolineaceae bacterium]